VDIGVITIILFSSLIIFLIIGVPLTMVLGGTAVIFSLLLWGPSSLNQIVFNTFGTMQNFILVAIPLFIFMGNILEKSGIAKSLYEAMYKWFGAIPGGLAIGTVIVCMIFAAMCGISGAATVSMGLIALPSMLEKRYDKSIAIGCIAAGGALGILIPPSVPFILYGLSSGESIGALFASGLLPGVLLGSLFIGYILIRCLLNKTLAPPLTKEERPNWKERFLSLKNLILPMLLILSVLGSIFKGIATPSEAAAVGALGAIGCAAVSRTLTLHVIKEACYVTLRLSSMLVWIIIGATAFTSLYTALGAIELIKKAMIALPISKYAILFGMQFIIFILGMLLDPGGIILITVPVFVPIIKTLGFDPIWFGSLFMINMEMAYLTPPFGFNLFYMKSIVPKGVTMEHIIKSIVPFVCLQGLCLIIVIIFPDIALWLPRKIFKI